MRISTLRRSAAWLLVLLLGALETGWAQGVQTGILRGVVTDQSGGALPGATVTIESRAMQGSRSAVTDESGSYVFRAIPPGDYTVTVTMPSFAESKRTVGVPVGGSVELNAELRLGGVTETAEVTAVLPTTVETAPVGLNIRQAEIEALSTSRTLFGIATLSPALNENTPNAGQLAINGAFAFDNIFMVNGVDVNDNLFGNAQALFIEEAIAETQVITSGISAEYGRFSGGVINAVTKSGGNEVSGSYRLNLTNPDWVSETPFERESNITHRDIVNKQHEMTLGGPILRDRLWFFGAGRLAKLSNQVTLRETGVGRTSVNDNKRGEIKLTGRLSDAHTLQGGYLSNGTTVDNTSGILSLLIDPNSLVTRELPNSYYFTNYRGVLTSRLLAEAQYSQRKFKFVGEGGTSTNILDSPFSALSLAAVYNAPYFDATDPESRNNRQLTGNVTYFMERAGRHELKAGYEWFRSQQQGGNSQSSTGYVFDADYVTNATGAPVLDASGRLIPIFTPGETLLENWLPVRGATLNIDNNSFYLQDHWTFSQKLTADLGLRYERVRSKATGNIVGVDTDTIVPRLALGYDINGNGRHVAHVTYAHYAGRYSEAQVGNNSNVANPDELIGVYFGPPGQGRNFAPGFNPANYETVFGMFPTANIFFESGLSSPLTKEFTTSYGAEIGTRAYADATYIWRSGSGFIEDYVSLANGVTDVVRQGVEAGTFTNKVYRNTAGDVYRRYHALVFQGRVRAARQLNVSGNWTIALKNEGNYEGEATNQPGVTSLIGDYPEAFSAVRNFPGGRLNNFQRHRARLWAIWDQGLGKFGRASFSGLIRVESGQSYSLRATGQPLSAIQLQRLAAYPDQPSSQTIYFGERGSELFKGYGVLDVSINYEIPIYTKYRPFLKLDVVNILNNEKLIQWNTVVTPDRTSPRDALGLPTGYVRGSRFGQGTANTHYPTSMLSPGIRGFRVAFGVRF